MPRFLLRSWLALSLLAGAAIAEEAPRHPLRERLRQSQEAPRQREAPNETRPGMQTHTLTHQGKQRTFLLYLPRHAPSGQPLPLVLAFHGGGGHAEQMATHYGLTDTAEREGFILIFPNGHSKFPGGKFATWNAGDCCGEARDSRSDDVGLVRAIVAAARARLPVDPERIFAVGMSNGGMMSYRLACEAADIFRAIASVAGTEAIRHCQPSRPVSILHIHARNDTHVLYNGGAGEGAFRDPDKVMDFVSVPDTIARWAGRNHCSGSPRRTLEHPAARCDAYTACRGGTTVQLCLTETGGHSWPGTQNSRPGKEPASSALNANDVIWAFLANAAKTP